MLSEEALKAAGPSCEALHAYFMEQSVNGVDDIHAKVDASYFESDGELSITVGFNDMYDLFNLDSLNISLLRCWTLRMKKQTEEMHCNGGFLDPQQPSGSMLCGFYVALNMLDLLGDISILKKASDYKVPIGRANQGALRMVQGMLCEFILKEIVDPKGKFFDGPADNP
ncbi:hypothetical protein C2845_PM05G13550 [Panicum miliaceum]|uniref:Ubiquitin-like protease family profile domain-containing protein n=1 Tax=Panicum miliaceum TaxID=4540 RepID=A0A3L6T3Z5_PANMI|nr:hypothetical protein C2845_PM05G13550 [Panicum miliaceum]